MPPGALLLMRLLLTVVVVLAAWRFGLRGVLALLLMVVIMIGLLRAGRPPRDGRRM